MIRYLAALFGPFLFTQQAQATSASVSERRAMVCVDEKSGENIGFDLAFVNDGIRPKWFARKIPQEIMVIANESQYAPYHISGIGGMATVGAQNLDFDVGSGRTSYTRCKNEFQFPTNIYIKALRRIQFARYGRPLR